MVEPDVDSREITRADHTGGDRAGGDRVPSASGAAVLFDAGTTTARVAAVLPGPGS